MIDTQEVTNWGELLTVLRQCSPEQLQQPIQVAKTHPAESHVHELCPGFCIGTVDQMEMLYARSSLDNRRNGDELVLFVDANPFAPNGASAYDWTSIADTPIFPNDYDESCDWTGPAQKLVDASNDNG